MDRERILDELWTFTPERMYILVAIARSKENSDVQATSQPTMRKMVEDRDELDDKIEQLSNAASRFEQQYRLYGTVNGRNARKGLHFLQKEMLDAQEESRKSGGSLRLSKRVDHEWKSIMHQPRCRDEKRFLWDVDDASPEARTSTQQTLEQHTESLLSVETPNGWHIVTEPFNFNALTEFEPSENEFHGYECERKNDDMVFLGFLGGES